MQQHQMSAISFKREGEGEHTVRHPAQFPDHSDHASWPHSATDASLYPDSSEDIDWMVPGIFSPDESDPDATSQGRADVYSPRIAGHHDSARSPNALQLDNIPMGYQNMDLVHPPFSYNDLYNDSILPNMSSAHPRQPLPQINTNDLSPHLHFHPHTPSSRSPADLSMPPAYMYHPSSAGASTPSTAGNSAPRTPAPLPATSQLTIPPNGAMYSPGSPYMYGGLHPSPSPTKSPFSPSPVGHSPSISPMATHQIMPRRPNQSVLEIASRYPDADLLICQKVYRPNTQSDRRRYVEEVDLELPIMFFLQHPDGCGISCKDAMGSRFSRLVDRDDAMFINRGPSVSIRINWPGYPPWSRQIPTRDFRSPPMPITRSKLAKNVAKTVQRFLDDKKDKAMEEDVDPRFKVTNITIDQIELVGLQHVSMGSWQAHLRLRTRSRT